MMKRVVNLGLSLALSSIALSQEDDNPTNRGRLMWSAFACATFAEMSGETQEQERLFDVGYSVGQSFLADIENETVSESEFQAAPVGVLLVIGGPSAEFILGRIYENAVGDAFDSVVKEDGNDLPILNPADWANEELRAIRAENKYLTSNCELIR